MLCARNKSISGAALYVVFAIRQSYIRMVLKYPTTKINGIESFWIGKINLINVQLDIFIDANRFGHSSS